MLPGLHSLRRQVRNLHGLLAIGDVSGLIIREEGLPSDYVLPHWTRGMSFGRDVACSSGRGVTCTLPLSPDSITSTRE